jgi:ABC-type lipoprotein export system ATPase subunit
MRPIGRHAPVAPPVIELRGIWREFGSDPPVVALRDVDLQVLPGEWLAILGPSGSGKSTLLNIIGLLDRPDRGAYLLEGEDVSSLGDLARAAVRGQRIGFVFQAFHLLPHRSVLENVMLAELYTGQPRHGRRERAMTALEHVDLVDRAGFLPTRLSGGQQQRAAIARALMGEPSLLLCDEPTGNLDTHSAEGVLDVFSGLSRQGMTLVVITHNTEVAARATSVAHIVDGELSMLPKPPAPQQRAADVMPMRFGHERGLDHEHL